MKQTRQQILQQYGAMKKADVCIHDQDELLCTYKTKTMTKAVFMTDILNRETFKKFCKLKNELNAQKMVVYCEYAYYDSPNTVEIILNRDMQTME